MAQIDAVRVVLGEIGAGDVPELLVFNKSDVAPLDAARFAAANPGSVAVSAATGAGIDAFLSAAADQLRSLTTLVELLVPFDRGDVMAKIHREGEVLEEEAAEAGMRLRARLDEAATRRLADFVVS